MLGSIRKFSTSIYAKVLLAIIIIPFVFWGMGGNFSGGSKNIVLVIDKEKYSIQQFVDFINKTKNKKVDANDIEGFLSNFIGEKLIEKEIENFKIKLSDKSLSKLIKLQKNFKRENKFSRTEYEKFLLENNITAVTFEALLSKDEKKRQLKNLIAGGIYPSKSLVNISYDLINQKRAIQFINLNEVFNKQLNFSQDQIKTYFENNKSKYSMTYKSFKFLELKPDNLTTNNDFSDLFFKRIDEIDDLIIEGNKIDFIINKFNLGEANSLSVNEQGQDTDLKTTNLIPKNIVQKIFNMTDGESFALVEDKNKYFIIEYTKTETIQKNIEDPLVKKKIISDLKNKTKRKLLSQIINEINKNNFKKSNFDTLSKNENASIKKVNLESRNDNSVFKKELVKEIYSYPENNVIVVNDLSLSENYLIYIDKITNVKIDDNSKEYQKYSNLSKIKIVNELYNTYDNYIQKKYKIDINYQGLDVVKNYFN